MSNYDPTKYFRGQGVLLISERDSNGDPTGFDDFGNCTALSASFEVEMVEVRESRTGDNFLAHQHERNKGVTIEFTAHSIHQAALERYFYGQTSTNVAGSATSEALTARPAKTVMLANRRVLTWTSLTDDAGAITYARYTGTNKAVKPTLDSTTNVFAYTAHGLSVGDRLHFTGGTIPTGFTASTDYWVQTAPDANTFTLSATRGGTTVDASNDGSDLMLTVQYDYEVDLKAGTIRFLAGCEPADGDQLRANYDYGATKKTQVYSVQNSDVTLLFKGLNVADTDKPVVVLCHKVRLNPAQEIQFIGDEVSEQTISGMLLYDDTKSDGQNHMSIEYVEE